MSTYTFSFHDFVIRKAEKLDISSVRVDQVCARPKNSGDGNDDDDDDDDDEDDDGNEYDDDRSVDYVHDQTKEEDLEIWTVSGTTRFKGEGEHTAQTLPCKGIKSAVKSYQVSLCLASGECISKSAPRKICTYEEGKRGNKFGSAVNLNDVDKWVWRL